MFDCSQKHKVERRKNTNYRGRVTAQMRNSCTMDIDNKQSTVHKQRKKSIPQTCLISTNNVNNNMNEAPTWRWTKTSLNKKKKVCKLSCERKQVEQQQKSTTLMKAFIWKKKKKKKKTCQCLRGTRVFNHMQFKEGRSSSSFFHLSFVAVPPQFVRCCFFFLLLTSLTCDDWVLVRIRVPPWTPGRGHHQTSCCQPFAKTALYSIPRLFGVLSKQKNKQIQEG